MGIFARKIRRIRRILVSVKKNKTIGVKISF